MSRIISARSDPSDADRQVAVRMVAIEQLRERAIGQRRRHVLQLQQPVQPQIADAIELALLEPRADQHVAHQLEAAIEIALERRQAEDGGVVTDVDVELRADAAERLVDVERRRSPQPSSSMSPVIAARPGRSGGSDDGPDRHQRQHARPAAPARCSTVQTRRPFGERRAADLGKRERALGPERRQAAAIGRHQETATGCDPRAPAPTRPRGTTLRTTRRVGLEPLSRAACAQPLGGRRAIALEVLLEVAGVAEEHVVGVQLIRLAAEPADGLQPEEEVRLGLRQAALELRRRSGRDR